MFRHPSDEKFESHYLLEHSEEQQDQEWTTENLGKLRDTEQSWIDRYKYEKTIAIKEINPTPETNILELGSGPGYLGQLIMADTNCDYTFVDKIGAKKLWEERGYKGTFILQNMMDGIDVTPLTKQYDAIIANDFLEHVSNPGNIVRNLHKHTPDHCKFLISVPNWRMGHDWIYRGLFDYDNIIYFMFTHGWNSTTVYESHFRTPFFPRTSSETMMQEELLTSWNWYFTFEKIKK